jgi:hypothetical protein
MRLVIALCQFHYPVHNEPYLYDKVWGGKLFILNFTKVTKYHRFYTLFHRPVDLTPSLGKQVNGTSDRIKGQHAPGHIHSRTQSLLFTLNLRNTSQHIPTQSDKFVPNFINTIRVSHS